MQEQKFSLPDIVFKSSALEKDLELVLSGNSYMVNSMMVSRNSFFVYDKFVSDPLLTKIEIKVPNGNYSNAVAFLQGDECQNDEQQCDFYLRLSHVLQSVSMNNKWKQYLHASGFELMDLIQHAYQHGFDISHYVKLLSSSIDDLVESPKFLDVPAPIIDRIFREFSSTIDVIAIKNVLTHFFDAKVNPGHRLMKYFPSTEYEAEYIDSIFANPKFSLEMARNHFEFVSYEKNDNSTLFEYSESSPFKGIIHSIYQPVVEASEPFNQDFSKDLLIVPDPSHLNGKYYCSKNGPNAFIIFSFNMCKVEIKQYVLQSWQKGSNKVCPRSWSIEGSNNGKNWVSMHSVKGNSQLIGDSAIATFKIDNPNPFSYIRFTQYETNHPRNNSLVLQAVEFFGKILH